jgi:tricorn protease
MRLLDIAALKSETISRDEFWGFYNDQPRFSPDDNYIAFSAYRNFEKDILIYNVKDKKVLNISDSGITESEPFWSPDGKYLYFSADRYTPSFPTGTQNSRIYRLPLEKLDREFRSNEFDKLFIEKKEAANDKTSKGKKKAALEKPPAVIIDFMEMLKRWELVSPDSGQQFSPYIIKQKEDTFALYISNHDGEKPSLWKTTFKPFEKPSTVKITGAEVNDLIMASAKDTFYILVKGSINTIDLKENKIKPIKMDYTFRRNIRAEFNQMFYEAWANLQENYYDENFHGRDWSKIRDYYAQFLSYLQSRADLRILLSDMLGELNSSHLGFYSQGDEEKTFYKMQTMQTGIIFDREKPYVVTGILKNSPSDKKDIGLQAGDVLTAVDGIKVDQNINRDLYFTKPSIDEEITLNFEREGKTFEVKLHPEKTSKFKKWLYDEWIEDNQKYVDQKSGGRIAYIYMKNMVSDELNNFIIEMTTEWYKKDALILDIRYNTGGNVHDAVLNFLARKPYLQWKYRGGKFAPQPNFAPAEKPIVLLVNEQSLSDAEMTAAGFKALKLGKIIGTETYRWLIFTSGKSLVDGSYYRLPSWGCYTLDGKDIERNGVVPDIYVQTSFKERLEGKDPQLDTAISEIKKELPADKE